jgi:hypothetical protein
MDQLAAMHIAQIGFFGGSDHQSSFSFGHMQHSRAS